MSELIECTLSYPPHLEDLVTIAVSDFGIQNFVLGGSNLLSGTKPETSITCYLEEEKDVTALQNFVKKRVVTSTLDGEISVQSSTIQKQQWEESWKQYWKPITISEKLIFKPSWETVKVSPEQIVVDLDTTMAFGTGSHETTKLCLEFLVERSKKPINSFLDVGCGSGVLSIAAAKLGATEVVGIDVSEQIIETSKQNAATNKISAEFYTTPVGELKRSFQLVTANIISSVLLTIWRDLVGCVEPGGQLIISGTIKEEIDDFLVDIRLEPIEVKSENEWVALLFQL